MTTSASKATAALLCVVAFGALVLAYVGLPSDVAVAEPVNLDLDFGVLVPGVAQSRTSPLDVPVPSTVRRAHAASTSGTHDVAVTIALCRGDSCRPLTTGDRIEAGRYTLRVSATLAPDLPPGTVTSIAGQLQLAETRSTGLENPNILIAVAGIGVVGAGIVALTSRRRSHRHGATP